MLARGGGTRIVGCMDRLEQPLTGQLERDSRPARAAPTGVGSDMEDATRLDATERLLDVRDERKNVFWTRRGNHQHDDAEPQTSDILLELQTAVGGDQGLESCGLGATEQFTIACAAPTHLRHGPGIVAGQRHAELPRQRLIDQNEHWPSTRPTGQCEGQPVLAPDRR